LGCFVSRKGPGNITVACSNFALAAGGFNGFLCGLGTSLVESAKVGNVTPTNIRSRD